MIMDPRLRIIFSRRSIRRYTGEPVAEADIQSLLEAGMAAPSGANRRPWHFIVVTDRATLTALADAHPYGGMIADAALGIAVCGDMGKSDWWVQDCSAATERAIREILGIPETIGVLSLLSIGHPAVEKPARTQFDPGRVHRDRW
jgi:nitroreductase